MKPIETKTVGRPAADHRDQSTKSTEWIYKNKQVQDC